ncbi:hypothetical protein Cgig2_005665 [Carnegiea gigantea]|uniref:Protein SAR DEFICIENT 1 n=1 Tax=Carnegiea gigantea TaxID=171969 RepID=A0A9Q1KVI2_9CARY|nr:hypothetical protein Cgig2_005665 [Carnegiea gigantea]
METKRLADDHDHDHDEPQEKRMRSLPSFASLIRQAMMVKSMNNFCSAMEPWLRKVVNEEVERGLQRTMSILTRSRSLRIQAPEPANLRLMFTNKSLPAILFTCNKILDINSHPLQLVLVEQRGDQVTPTLPPYPLKLEIIVIDGGFPSTDSQAWTVDEFNRNVLKERAGKRPLLTKDLNYTIRDNNNCVTLGDIEFTDNSSWIPCRKFKIGARVVAETSPGCSRGAVRILEALTDAFIVKDHRGESYKKHYPPRLEDEVWRLENIGKDGIFHRRLAQAGVLNVQDFLKLSVINPINLKRILGGKKGISERKWESILKHARTSNLGNKLYISTGPNYSIVLDPICQILSINLDGETYSSSDLNLSLKKEVDRLVENAYRTWDSLQEVERPVNETFQPPQGNLVGECGNHEQNMMSYEVVIGGIIEVDGAQFTNDADLHIPFEDWSHNLD